MGSHIFIKSACSRLTFCTGCQGNTACAFICRHHPSQGVHQYQHCHHHRVLLFPGGAVHNQHNPPATIHPAIRLHSKHSVSSGCFGAVCLDNEMQGKQTITLVGRRQTLLCRSETVQVLPVPLHWNRCCSLTPSLRDGANMRHISGVARVRYLLARWKPNAVNYIARLPNHFSPREMAGQDKLVILQKQSILKGDVLSTVRTLQRDKELGNKATLGGDNVRRAVRYVSWWQLLHSLWLLFILQSAVY